MRELVIIGAGGLGREVAWAVMRVNGSPAEPKWKLAGFADDAPGKSSGTLDGLPLLGAVATVAKERPDAAFFIAVGDNATRERIARELGGREFPAVVDPSALVAPSAVIGEGAFVAPLAVVSAGASVGRFAIVNARAGVGHDSRLGAFSQVCPGASLSGATVLGERAFVGTNACTLPGVSVGADAKIAGGTPAYSNVPAGATLSPFGTLRTSRAR